MPGSRSRVMWRGAATSSAAMLRVAIRSLPRVMGEVPIASFTPANASAVLAMLRHGQVKVPSHSALRASQGSGSPLIPLR